MASSAIKKLNEERKVFRYKFYKGRPEDTVRTSV